LRRFQARVLRASAAAGLLFLYNNLHVLHHLKPGISRYYLPSVYGRNREALIASNGGLLYNSYWDIARRFFLKPQDTLTHPEHS
jgi:fatty acid desaturase